MEYEGGRKYKLGMHVESKIMESSIYDNWSINQGSNPVPPKYASGVWILQMQRLVLTECKERESFI